MLRRRALLWPCRRPREGPPPHAKRRRQGEGLNHSRYKAFSSNAERPMIMCKALKVRWSKQNSCCLSNYFLPCMGMHRRARDVERGRGARQYYCANVNRIARWRRWKVPGKVSAAPRPRNEAGRRSRRTARGPEKRGQRNAGQIVKRKRRETRSQLLARVRRARPLHAYCTPHAIVCGESHSHSRPDSPPSRAAAKWCPRSLQTLACPRPTGGGAAAATA